MTIDIARMIRSCSYLVPPLCIKTTAVNNVLISSVSPKTPTLISSNTGSTLETGTTVTLTCATTSTGQATYKFSVNGTVKRDFDQASSYDAPNTAGIKSITCTAKVNGVESAPSSVTVLKFVGKFCFL